MRLSADPAARPARAMTPGPDRLLARDLVLRRGARAVLDGLTLAVAAAERVMVLGPSGSGKTTLLRLLAGLDAPDAGVIEIDGRLASMAGRVVVAPHARGVGMVFQSAALWPHMTAAQNIGFGLGGRPGFDVRARVAEMLERVGLAGMGERYPDQLSGGEARRVALARALAGDPRLLLMDEPLTSLDPDLRSAMLDLVDRMVAASGASLVYVTHVADEAAKLAGRVVVLEGGRLRPAS